MKKKKITPFEVAVDLIRVYAERGDDVESFKLGGLGFYGSDYHASIGGSTRPLDYYKEMKAKKFSKDIEKSSMQHMKILHKYPGKSYPKTKIVIQTINGEPVNEIFSIYKVWDYVLEQKKQKALF